MNGNMQMEAHYINTGFPCTVMDSFMDLFEGLAYSQADAAMAEALGHEGSGYSSMLHTSTYKYGFPGPSRSFYSSSHGYATNNLASRLDGGRRVWNSTSFSVSLEPQQLVQHGNGSTNASTSPGNVECTQAQHSESSPQIVWQDNVDPDNMTYEELLDLGEAVGTQSRGLSQVQISSLPIKKYKHCFFSRKKCKERCVICQMRYKKGDRQMALPCKHVYHASCVTRWLSISKACPICLSEVPVEEPRHQ